MIFLRICIFLVMAGFFALEASSIHSRLQEGCREGQNQVEPQPEPSAFVLVASPAIRMFRAEVIM